MEMSTALQIALFVASLAIVVLVVCLVPITIQVGRSLKHLAVATERLEATAETLLQDSREVVRNVSELSDRTNRYMEEVGKMARVVQLWTERADLFATQVASLVEPPMLSLVHSSKVLRVGAAAFLWALFHPRQQQRSEAQLNPTKEEKHYV